MFLSPPTQLPIFSHGSLFQLIFYSVGRARRPPSVDKVNNSPPHPSPACKSRGEGSVGELSPPLYFSPHHFQCFLTAAFFNFIAVPLAVPAAFPQFRRQIRARRRYPPNASCFEKAVTVSFCHIFIFPHHSFFPHRIFIHLIAIQFSAPATLPLPIKGAMARRRHPRTQLV